MRRGKATNQKKGGTLKGEIGMKQPDGHELRNYGYKLWCEKISIVKKKMTAAAAVPNSGVLRFCSHLLNQNQ